MSSKLLKLQLVGVNPDWQQLFRNKLSSSSSSCSLSRSFGHRNTRLVGIKVQSPWSRKAEESYARFKCGALSDGSDRETSTSRVSEDSGAAAQTSWVGIDGGRFAALTAMAIGLSFFVDHGIGSSSAANVVVATFPWEKPQELVQAEPSKGSCATCIGVVDETLGTCNSTLNCVSSFDDRPNFFVAPWEFPGQLSDALKELKATLLGMGAEIIAEPEERYVHAIFTEKADGFIDDVEFLFSNPSEDATIVIRAACRAQGVGDNDRNRRRLEQIRGTLTWEQVPILRNRNRALFFLESPWDSFGPEPPPTYDYKESLDMVRD